MEALEPTAAARAPWNKGKLVGQKTPLKLKEIWAIRIRLQLANRRRELALFNLAIDSKLRACDLVKAQGATCLSWANCSLADDRTAAKDSKSRPVRDYGADTGVCRGLDRSRGTVSGQQPISKPTPRLDPPIHPPVRSNRGFLGQTTRIGQGELRDAYAQANEGHPDLPPYQEPAGCSDPSGAFEVGEHSPLPRHRGERRPGNG
jgi:hypothetical protein